MRGQLVVHAGRVQPELCRSVLDVSDSLNGLSLAGKSDTRSKYEYRV